MISVDPRVREAQTPASYQPVTRWLPAPRTSRGGSRYGSRMRPGAPFAPSCVWHELQSPVGAAPVIARSRPPALATILKGALSVPVKLKFPAAFETIDAFLPLASVMLMVTAF